MKLILATKNPGKIQEIQKILGDLDVVIISMEEAGFTDEIVEDGKTFEENAIIKARAVAQFTHEWTLAEDSGICIDALNGEPGITSARWAGDHATTKQIVDFTLEKMKNFPEGKRGAHFEAVVAIMHPNGSYRTFIGKAFGKLTREPRGELREGVPYSIIFIPDGYNKTYCEISIEAKNKISSRGASLQKAKTFLKNEVLKGETK